MPKLRDIEEPLTKHAPERIPVEGKAQASVAVVLRELDDDLEMLFIERARRAGDPWSGQMAFPGGRREAVDADSVETAMRETEEEVGLSLVDARHLGLLGEMAGRPRRPTGGIVVSAHVFHVQQSSSLVLNEEVEDAFWFPVRDLLDTQRHVDWEHEHAGDARFPGVLVGRPERHVVWGLTYRFLEVFLRVAGKPLPERWAASELGRWTRVEE